MCSSCYDNLDVDFSTVGSFSLSDAQSFCFVFRFYLLQITHQIREIILIAIVVDTISTIFLNATDRKNFVLS